MTKINLHYIMLKPTYLELPQADAQLSFPALRASIRKEECVCFAHVSLLSPCHLKSTAAALSSRPSKRSTVYSLWYLLCSLAKASSGLHLVRIFRASKKRTCIFRESWWRFWGKRRRKLLIVLSWCDRVELELRDRFMFGLCLFGWQLFYRRWWATILP